MELQVVQDARDAGESIENFLLSTRGHVIQHVHEVMVEGAEGDP